MEFGHKLAHVVHRHGDNVWRFWIQVHGYWHSFRYLPTLLHTREGVIVSKPTQTQKSSSDVSTYVVVPSTLAVEGPNGYGG